MATISDTRKVFNDVLNLDTQNLFAVDLALCVLVLPRLAPSLEMVFACLAGPAGCGKSEILTAMLGCPELTHELEHISAQAFISGFIDKDHPEKDYSLLPKINGKTLINDDFLHLTSGDPRKVEEIISQLHSGYKGRSIKSFGTGEKSYESRYAVLAASTPVIDMFFIKMQRMGARFLKFNFIISPEDYNDMVDDALIRHAEAETWRSQLQAVTRDLLLPRLKVLPRPKQLLSSCTIAHRKQLADLARFAAAARSLPQLNMTKASHWLASRAEVGRRIAKQLHVITATRCYLDGRTEWSDEDMAFARRLAWDTVPELCHRIFEVLHERPGLDRATINRKTFSKNVNLEAVLGQYVVNRLLDVQSDRYHLSPKTLESINQIWSSNPCLNPVKREKMSRRSPLVR